MVLEEELLKRFIAGHCTEQEEKYVMEYLRANPGYFEEYCSQHPILMEEEFNKALKDNKSEILLNDIYHGIGQKKHKRSKGIFVALAGVAAALLIMFIFLNRKSSVPGLEPASRLTESKITKVNNTSEVQTWILSDSSVIEAQPGARVTYLPNFTNRKRELFLKGEACFTAHHENARSFVVVCDGIATTALGTRFRVKGEEKKVTVILYEGKVSVRNIQQEAKTDLCYLDPGMSTIFYKNNQKFITTSNFVKNKNRIVAGNSNASQTNIAANKGTIILDNLSMQDALDKLAMDYNVEIQYSPGDIQFMNIIANIPKTQSINKILNNLANANGLIMTKLSDSAFLIEKK
jgi:hypothetical protein